MALNWEDSNFLWNDNPHTWDDVQLVVSLIESRGASVPEILWQVDNLDPEKKRRFIKLVCKVKGIETYSGQKTMKTEDIKISADDVKLVVKDVLGIDLTVENIHV
jgi:type II secretory pathway component PulL